MTQFEYIFNSILGYFFEYGPYFAALILGLMLPAVVVALSGISTKWSDHSKLVVIFASIVIGTALSIAFSGRYIVSAGELETNPYLAISSQPGNEWFSRIAHLIFLSISISEIFNWCIGKRRMEESQFYLWCAAMAYFILSVPVSAVFGHLPEFNINLFYAPIVFTAVALLVSSDFCKFLRALRWILIIPLIGSLLAIWFKPNLVMEHGYNSLIPGLSIRLAGLTLQANSLGILAAVSFFIEISQYVRKKPNVLFLLIILTNLLLSQSKTSWVIAIIGIVISRLDAIKKLGMTYRKNDAMLALFVGGLFLTTIIFIFLFYKIETFQNFLDTDRTGLVTFTGRTQIWEITWNEFLKSPIYGYGPSLWDLRFRAEKGLMHVGQAHNQYIQTLGQAGLLGIIGLLFYILQLLRKGFSGWEKTSGFSFLIVFLLLVRGFSETPMRMIGILDTDSFVHLLVFATVISVTIQEKKVS